MDDRADQIDELCMWGHEVRGGPADRPCTDPPTGCVEVIAEDTNGEEAIAHLHLCRDHAGQVMVLVDQQGGLEFWSRPPRATMPAHTNN
jgi:hypothetical protein